jgi:hypothetical protein
LADSSTDIARTTIAPAILAIGGGSYGALYAVAGACAVIGAVASLRVRGVG